MPKGFEPWIAVKVGVRKNRKLAGLPDDTARYGWLAGVLAEAKLQRPGGRFDSRGQLEEAVGRFAGYVDDYLRAGLLEVAGRLCSTCRKVWSGLPTGTYVVHDWRAHQRDPFSAARAEAWRDERDPEHENDGRTNDERFTNDDGTTDERTSSESDSQDERATNTVDSRDVTADSRARGKTQDSDSDKDSGDSPQPPSRAGGRSSRANGTSPRQRSATAQASATADAKARAWRRQQRQLAVYRGALTDSQRGEMDAADAPVEQIPDWAEHLTRIEADQAATSERPDWLTPAGSRR